MLWRFEPILDNNVELFIVIVIILLLVNLIDLTKSNCNKQVICSTVCATKKENFASSIDEDNAEQVEIPAPFEDEPSQIDAQIAKQRGINEKSVEQTISRITKELNLNSGAEKNSRVQLSLYYQQFVGGKTTNA